MALALLTATLDTSEFRRQMTALEKDQLPFAASLAINRTVVKMQSAVRASLASHFTIAPARVKFMEMMVRFHKQDYATKVKLEAKFGVNDSEGPGFLTTTLRQDRGFILGRHESGGVRQASADHPFAIPTKALRPGEFDLPPRNLYPTALGIFGAKYTIAPRKVSPIKRVGGQRRAYFVLRSAAGQPIGIFERYGQHPAGSREAWQQPDRIRLVWAFRTTITLKPRLHFYETANRVREEVWVSTFEEAMAEAIRTAR
jgi:hypothetical protein